MCHETESPHERGVRYMMNQQRHEGACLGYETSQDRFMRGRV